MLAGSRQIMENTRPSHLEGPMMPPPRAIRSAPNSNMPSPNVSPPNRYVPYLNSPQSFNPYGAHQPTSSSWSNYPPAPEHNDNVNMLATAATELERARQLHARHERDYSFPPMGRLHPISSSSSRYSNTLAMYSISHPASRSHSRERDDPYSHRHTKKSRPNSPFSTAPPSPTFSHDSLSPTPDHTPIVTPGHSPRLRPLLPYADIHLPQLRSLSLQATPPIPAMEPHAEPIAPTFGRPPTSNMPSSSLRISDILARPETIRKLPIPRMAMDVSAPPVVDVGPINADIMNTN